MGKISLDVAEFITTPQLRGNDTRSGIEEQLDRVEQAADRLTQVRDYSEPPMRTCACGAPFQYGPMCESCWAMQQESASLQSY